MWSAGLYANAAWDDFVDAAAPSSIRLPRLPSYARGASPSLAHWHVVGQVLRAANRWFGRQARVDKDRHHRGRSAAKRRPDLQIYNTDRRRTTHVEVDTERSSMNAHIRDHLAYEPNRRGVFLLIDPATGALLEKYIVAAGSGRAVPAGRGTVAQPLPLHRSDLFDSFETLE